jgi:hypothetical protein
VSPRSGIQVSASLLEGFSSQCENRLFIGSTPSVIAGMFNRVSVTIGREKPDTQDKKKAARFQRAAFLQKPSGCDESGSAT